MLFSSKANTLLELYTYTELAIPRIFVVDFVQWQEQPCQIVQKIQAWVQEDISEAQTLAVRSSCTQEDGEHSSGAGLFTSILHIPYDDDKALTQAISTVFTSYGQAEVGDQVFLQPMIKDIAVSGVIMTRVLDDGSPYYVINYDDESGRTDSITGGHGGTKTVYVYREAQEKDFDSIRLWSFVRLARRVEAICRRNDLDIEFCQSHHGKVHLLQVRPICAQHQWAMASGKQVKNNIHFLVDFVKKRTQPWPALHGQSTILGVMPDWNPAEMLGVTPRPLASSLYRELITRNIWRKAREYMGYKPIPPEELMILLAGRPYIDVRLSFNSFLPAGLCSNTCEALVSAWLDYLDTHPQYHDKIEFNVAQTALDFSFDAHFDARYGHDINTKHKEKFRRSLTLLTNACLNLDSKGSLAYASACIEKLRQKQEERSQKDNALMISQNLFLQIISLCEECKRLGTLPFAILARHAFIAETLLRTAAEREALCADRLQAFKHSVQTVAGQMTYDFLSASQENMSHAEFIRLYGHLRPSSYDILSPRYADRKDLFFLNERQKNSLPPLAQGPSFAFTAKEQNNLNKLLREAGLRGDAAHFEAYARKAITGREWAKFVFSKNLSDMLELLAVWGNRWNFDREALSFLDFRHAMEWAQQALLQSPEVYFAQRIHEGRTLFTLSRSLKLSYLIRSARDMYIVPQHRSAPNFIGKGRVEAEIVYVQAHSSCSMDLNGRLVCIENADPGFDWIFTRPIAGLITKFGGTNSHMAIRCAEYGLPAAIGVGEMLFENIRHMGHCVLNAGDGTLHAL